MCPPGEQPNAMSHLRDLVERIRSQARAENIRVTLHAHQEMVEEGITLDELLEALSSAEMLENYPQHRRGACCLVAGSTASRRPLHVVCTTAQPTLVIVTVYEPRPPKWVTPERRGGEGDEL